MSVTPPKPADATSAAPGAKPSGATPDPVADSPATRGQDRKLSEALGFASTSSAPRAGSPSASAPVVSVEIGASGTREPKKAFTSGRTGEGGDAPSGAAFVASFGSGLGGPTAAGAGGGAAPRPTGAAVADSAISIPAGAYLAGEEKKPAALPAYQIDRDPVTHGEYEVFVLATGHRPPLYWKAGRCPEELREHPVVGVDYFDALAYARWAKKDLPFEDEWERAARGTDGRTYPWGDEPDLVANTARTGLRSTVPVGFFPKNTSPDGCRDMVGNVWEITHTPAPGGGIVVRGGSWFDFALYAKTYFRFASRPEARNGTIGFRCVRRASPRADAARAVTDSEIDAALAARRGRAELPDPATWSAERRDLVPDFRRLRQVLVLRDADEAEARRTPAPSPNRPLVKRAFAGTSAPAAGTPVPAAMPAPVAMPAPAPAPVARPVAPPPLPTPMMPPGAVRPPVTAAVAAAVPVSAPITVGPPKAVATPVPAAAPVAVTPPKPVVVPAAVPAPVVAAAPIAVSPPKPVVVPAPVPAPVVAVTPIPVSPPKPVVVPAPVPAPVVAAAPIAVPGPKPIAAPPPTPASTPAVVVAAPVVGPAAVVAPSPPSIPAPGAPAFGVPHKLPSAPASSVAPTSTPVVISPPKAPSATPAPTAAASRPTEVKPLATPEPAPFDPSVRVFRAPAAPPTASAAPPQAPASAPASKPPPSPDAAPLPPWAVAKVTPPPPPPPPAPWLAGSAAKSSSAPTTPPVQATPPAFGALPGSKSTDAAARPAAPAPISVAPVGGPKPSGDAWGPAHKDLRPAPTDVAMRTPGAGPSISSVPVSPAGPVTKAPLNPLAPSRPASPFPMAPGAPAVGSLTYAAEQAAKAVGSGVIAPGLPKSVNVASGADEAPSSLRVALLVMGLLAAAVLVVVGLLRLSDREKVTNVEVEAHRLGLPSIVRSDSGDAAEPSVLLGDEARSTLTDLEQGAALLVFADPATPAFVETAELAVELHRRLRGSAGLRVVLVVPAEPGAADAADAAMRQSLRTRGVTSDLLVLVDPVDDAGRPGLWRRTRFDVPEYVAAVLLESGLQSMRVSPPTAVGPLTRSHVAPLVREAVARHPGGAADEPSGDEDPTNGEGDGLPERGPRGGVPPPK